MKLNFQFKKKFVLSPNADSKESAKFSLCIYLLNIKDKQKKKRKRTTGRRLGRLNVGGWNGK